MTDSSDKCPELSRKLVQLGLPKLESWRPVSGGCIADSGRAELADGRTVFIKQGEQPSDQYAAEAAGLDALRASAQLRVPKVLAVGQDVLVLEWIDTGRAPADFFRRFGKAIAQLHQNTNSCCGFDQDNYLGSSPQINAPVCATEMGSGDGSDWPEFFLKRRLQPQVEWASRRPDGAGLAGLLERSSGRVADLLAAAMEPPALLHGDLWSGNFMVDTAGQAVLIDPAVYFGHREADLAMTRLFGGFDAGFFTAYEQASPLMPGWQARLPVYQLYHLLNHYNLFGGSYLPGCQRILRELAR